MTYISDSQGATLYFNGVELGRMQGVDTSVAAGNVQEVTSLKSPVMGQGQNARLLKQYNCTSVEPGTMQLRFIGSAGLNRNDIGGPGRLVLTWPNGTLSWIAFCSDLQAGFSVGQLQQWTATFQATGFTS